MAMQKTFASSKGSVGRRANSPDALKGARAIPATSLGSTIIPMSLELEAKRVAATKRESNAVLVAPAPKLKHIDIGSGYRARADSSDERSLYRLDATGRLTKVRNGLSYDALSELAKDLQMSVDDLIAFLKLPRSTLKRNQKHGTPLSLANSDCIDRARQIYERAKEIFVEEAAALRWLKRGQKSMEDDAPLARVDTTAGYEFVLNELLKIEVGVVA
jgi:putative toxin-antitoxin system antitoxin component (TIGR02293 family)